MRYFLTIFVALIFSACSTQTSTPTPTPTPTPTATATATEDGIPLQQSLPSSLTFVGDATIGNQIITALEAEGIKIAGKFAGKESGLEKFCSGHADGLALVQSFTDEERNLCKKMGGDWSALSKLDGSLILFIKYIYADAFLERSITY